MTNTVTQISDWLTPKSPKLPTGGEPPYDGGMEARVTKLEALVPTMATKEDLLRLEIKLHQELNVQTWKFVTWMTGICTALIAATYFIANHVAK